MLHLVDDEQRPIFRTEIYPADILTDDAQYDQLGHRDKDDQKHRAGPSRNDIEEPPRIEGKCGDADQSDQQTESHQCGKSQEQHRVSEKSVDRETNHPGEGVFGRTGKAPIQWIVE